MADRILGRASRIKIASRVTMVSSGCTLFKMSGDGILIKLRCVDSAREVRSWDSAGDVSVVTTRMVTVRW